jgi:hypothetical protein
MRILLRPCVYFVEMFGLRVSLDAKNGLLLEHILMVGLYGLYTVGFVVFGYFLLPCPYLTGVDF